MRDAEISIGKGIEKSR